MKKHLLIGIVISGVCLYLAFRGIDFRELTGALQTARLEIVAAAMAVYFVSFLFRSVRWSLLLKPFAPATPGRVLAPLFIGFFGNTVLPFRLGEIVRAHAAGRKFNVSRATTLGTILSERLLDSLSFLVIFLASVMVFPYPAAVKRGAFSVLAGAGLLLLFLMMGGRDRLQKAGALAARVPLPERFRDRVHSAVRNLTEGFITLRRTNGLPIIFGLSLLVWTAEAAGLWVVRLAFPDGPTFFQCFFLLFFLALATAIPQAPGYVGTMELFGASALGLLGYSRNESLSFMITVHANQIVFIVLVGMASLYREGISLRRNWKELDTK